MGSAAKTVSDVSLNRNPEGSQSMHPLSVEAVRITDDFWEPRQETNRTETLPLVYEMLEETDRLRNLEDAVAGERPKSRSEALADRMYRDESDVYKWLEAASYALADDLDPALDERVDDVIELLEEAQDESGYLNSYFTLYAPEQKLSNLGWMHELYSAGHLFEAAAAHYRATGDRRLLDMATAFADFLDETFDENNRGIPGHEGIELGLLRLYWVTGEDSYRDLAKYFVDQRGREDSPLRQEVADLDEIAGDDSIKESYRERLLDEDGEYDGRHIQDHEPVRDQETVEGHAVRATYLYTAVTALARETGEDDLADAAKRLWENLTTKRMYVTGGVGN